ncbi:MAG: IPT/TIG domain-containing protein [bacterium]
MKNLSFALALALVCISMFSCGEKSVITPLVEDFKITTFSPVSAFDASDITLFGENLDKDSIISVSFGDQTAEIISLSSDSLEVKVPRIAVGKYDISVKTKTKSFVYENKFEVLYRPFLDDLTQIKNYEFSVKGFKVSHRVQSSYISYPSGGGHSDTTLVDTAITKNYKNHFSLSVQNINTNQYKIIERYAAPYAPQKTAAYIVIDMINHKFITLKLDSYYYKQFGVSDGTVTEEYNFSLDLEDVGFQIGENDSVINVKLTKQDISSKLKNIFYDFHQEFHHSYRPTSSSYTDSYIKLLGINDDATIEIKFTK